MIDYNHAQITMANNLTTIARILDLLVDPIHHDSFRSQICLLNHCLDSIILSEILYPELLKNPFPNLKDFKS